MTTLENLRVAVLVTDGFEESELTQPIEALRREGARVEIVSPNSGEVQGFRHTDPGIRVRSDRTLSDAKGDQYDALLLPGGAINADTLRVHPRAKAIVKEFDEAGKPIAALCHAPWTLISAGIVRGRKLTSYHTLQDDIRNAGGDWVDEQVVVDGNWVTSRKPADIPAFNREMIGLFSRSRPDVINVAESA